LSIDLLCFCWREAHYQYCNDLLTFRIGLLRNWIDLDEAWQIGGGQESVTL